MAVKVRIVGVSTSRPLISDTDIRRDLGGLSRMSIWRWDHDPDMAALGWPPPESVNGRNHRDAEKYESFRGRLAREAIARRNALLQQRDTETMQGEDQLV
jgi:hypothetical protein